ncbi:Clavaminate synthase-like protein [Dichomitus squalens LYAD-421 SS1]|uniref:Clavaminate synthase-like protein n=1 Tax=Dichomitus squalens (strain LYAD-421) TaxID=732165 RepID=R7STY4_DICSQ|nr:Clavaminate synthase-like protein [Dichomitus squalens LYAD-421 SS1]EJF59541.1 Clavaminate synthase-like protein [Dichomitus squalens LYAD-421 SS1]
MPGILHFPAFPEGAGDEREIDRLWQGATELGFWYLKNHGIDDEIDAMFDLGAQTLALPLDKKMPYHYQEDGSSFGYKSIGSCVIDEKGTRDTTESIDVSQDDVLVYPIKVHQAYPATIGAGIELIVRPFVAKSMDINFHLLGIMDGKLGLPKGTLASLCTPEEHSGSTLRLIRNPPATTPSAQTFVGAHTDFGALTILHNRLGGLQVLVPGQEDWQYVKPLEGHAICNIGDALNIFSGGIMRSNIHRVVPPPKEQAKLERLSLVFFTRPSFTAPMRALTEHSTIVAEAVAKAPAEKFDTGVTAGEWLARRMRSIRATQFKDSETLKAGFKGTEDIAL